MKNKLYKLIDRTSVGHKAISDRRFRVLLYTGASLLCNLIYGIYNGALGVVYSSAWFGVLSAYYLALFAMRLSVMPLRANKIAARSENDLMVINGIALIALGFVLSFVVLESLLYSVNTPHNEIVMITIAIYTFYSAISAVRNLTKAHRESSALMITVRNISLASATASMMSLERSMISTFSDRSSGYGVAMDAYVGAGGFIVVLALGISMIVMGTRRKRLE